MSSPTPAPDTRNDRNNWNCYESDELFSWAASIPVPDTPDVLRPWQDLVLAAGERHGVLRVERIDRLGYDRRRDGFVGDVVRTHPDRLPAAGDWYPEGFVLGLWMDLVTATRLAYATGAGIAEDWFTDMREVAARAGVPRCGSAPPVTLYTDGGAEHDGRPAVAVHFGLTSDIWFPWNPPADHPRDNRPLARRNGTRLDAFLAEVRAATAAAGGSWTPPRPPPPWDVNGLTRT